MGGDENSKSILSVITNLLVFMLSTITLYSNTFGGGAGCTTTTGEASSCGNPATSQCTTTTGTQPSTICQPTQQAAAQIAATPKNCDPCSADQAPSQSTNGCSFQAFCDKVKNGTCNVLKEIKEECDKYKECNECTGSEEICTKFISVTMEQCEKEAKNLIIQLNEDISPESLNTIILRFIGLQLYLRIIQEFTLLRDYFTKIIKNLSTCDIIKSCTCGDNITRCCSIKGKCLCTIFYKLFIATITLHDRYCKIIGYMKGECDEDLYKVIPSLSLTRSIIILTSYFNEYISSNYMVEEDKCTCREKNTCPKQSLLTLTADLVFGIGSIILNTITGVNDGTCNCHRYSSKLDDVVTLLLEGIEDTDDCDGLLSDVISMMSPLVKVEDYRSEKVKTELTEDDKKNENDIDKQLQEVNQKKCDLNNVIGLNGGSSCDGTAASGGVTGSSTNGCTSCDTDQTSADTPNNGCSGTIATACSKYIDNADTTGCGSNNCECKCKACTSGKVEWTCQPGRTKSC